MGFYLQGLSVGLAYVAPIGMQNMFVINTALTKGKKRAYLTALIIIFFDISLSLACFYGIGAAMEALPWLERIVLCVGSLLVIWIGVGLIRSKAVLGENAKVDISLWQVVSTAFVVTWLNPQALIDGTMLLGAFRATLPAGAETGFVVGFLSASVFWFSGVTTLISIFSAKITEKLLRWINIACGAVMILYGIKLLIQFVRLIVNPHNLCQKHTCHGNTPGKPVLPW